MSRCADVNLLVAEGHALKHKHISPTRTGVQDQSHDCTRQLTATPTFDGRPAIAGRPGGNPSERILRLKRSVSRWVRPWSGEASEDSDKSTASGGFLDSRVDHKGTVFIKSMCLRLLYLLIPSKQQQCGPNSPFTYSFVAPPAPSGTLSSREKRLRVSSTNATSTLIIKISRDQRVLPTVVCQLPKVHRLQQVSLRVCPLRLAVVRPSSATYLYLWIINHSFLRRPTWIQLPLFITHRRHAINVGFSTHWHMSITLRQKHLTRIV